MKSVTLSELYYTFFNLRRNFYSANLELIFKVTMNKTIKEEVKKLVTIVLTIFLIIKVK